MPTRLRYVARSRLCRGFQPLWPSIRLAMKAKRVLQWQRTSKFENWAPTARFLGCQSNTTRKEAQNQEKCWNSTPIPSLSSQRISTHRVGAGNRLSVCIWLQNSHLWGNSCVYGVLCLFWWAKLETEQFFFDFLVCLLLKRVKASGATNNQATQAPA